MLSKAVVGTDFSKPSAAVLDYVPRLTQAGLQEVVLVHVTRQARLEGVEQMMAEGFEEPLERQAEQLRAHGLEVTQRVEQGSTAVVLADVAEQEGAEAIIVGSRGRSLLGRILLGSVSMSVLHQATVPVLIVRVDLCETDEGISCELQPGRPLEHILFPTDFSPAANYALDRTRDLFGGNIVKATLLHVDNPPAYEESEATEERIEALHARHRDQMEIIADELRRGGVEEVGIVVKTGSPAVSAIKFAEANDVSMIAMGTQGRGEMEELLVGSVAMKIARTSPVAVLMIPRPR